MKEVIVIGPSNGWLYGMGIFSLRQQGEFLEKTGANAIELCGTAEDSQRLKSLLGEEEFGDFLHISLHLSDYDGSKSLIEQVCLVEKIVERRKPMHCLIHPLEVSLEYLEALIARNIPLAIENMDENKNSGFNLKELEKLLQEFKLGFVLDVQHAFEHDPSMEYAFNLFQMAKNKLVYFHVSGETEDNNHALVHQSRNCKAIVDFLGRVFSEINAPIIIILEGEYKTPAEVNQEINFLIKAVG